MTVKQIQCLLTYLGYSLGAIDGADGKNTQAAIWAFQADYGLTVDGIPEFPIVKDTTPNMMNPRLYTTSYNKPQGQQFDDTAVLSFIKLQYT